MAEIRIIDDFCASRTQWQETCDACPYATYFHTPEWAELFSAYTRGRLKPVTRKITFDDHRSVIVPLCRIDYVHGVFKIYQSAAAGTFGGWISVDPLGVAHAQTLVEYMLGLGNISWRENPYDPCLREVAIPGSIDDFTQTIDLTKSAAQLIAASSRAHVKALNKARREGVTVKEAEGIDDWLCHYTAYEQSLVRWKNAGTAKKLVKPYTWELFNAIFEKKSPHCKLWCARYKEKIAASVLCFYWNRHAVAWHGAGLEEFFEKRPNNLLYQHIVFHARDNGFSWFDCNTPGGLKGVVEFKDHLGTQRLKSRIVDKISFLRKILRKVKRMR